MDVVHDLRLEEGLGGVIHDLVAELGLGDVLPELLDASASGLLGAVLIHNFVTNILGSSSILQKSLELLDHLKLAPEQGILGLVHDVRVELQEVLVDPRHGLHEALVAGGELELLEQADDDADRGGAGEADL